LSVERYFQKRADEFDALYDESRWWYRLDRLLRRGLYERVELTLREMRDLGNFSVLDVGCGSGRNAVLFAGAGAGRVVGIDFSSRMIELAKELSRTRGVDARCEFIQADFLEYPATERFDVVAALGVFDYLAEPQAFLERMMQLATRKVIASFPRASLIRAPLRKLRYGLRNCPVYFTTEEKLAALCRTAGLRSFRLVPYASSGLLLVGDVAGA
jgi:ubiquinone/menaquinone biosynthesis C-methylase UbiE